jgi:hypothetical protein
VAGTAPAPYRRDRLHTGSAGGGMGERASLRFVSHAPAMTRAVPASEMAATDSSLKTTPARSSPPVGNRSLPTRASRRPGLPAWSLLATIPLGVFGTGLALVAAPAGAACSQRGQRTTARRRSSCPQERTRSAARRLERKRSGCLSSTSSEKIRACLPSEMSLSAHERPPSHLRTSHTTAKEEAPRGRRILRGVNQVPES